jgi:hemerythrin-like domain-containing protein
MFDLTDLKNQHDAAMAMADRLIDMIDEYRHDGDALPIAIQFSKLVGLFRVHFAQEDVQLYPELVALGDREVARMTLTYAAEMGGLANELERFVRRWPSSAVIAGSFNEFADAARGMVLALAVRIERENRFLYPLAEAVAA